MDNNDERIDSLFNEQNWNILPSGVIDDDGKVIMTTYNKVEVPLTDSQIGNVFMAEKIRAAHPDPLLKPCRNVSFHWNRFIG